MSGAERCDEVLRLIDEVLGTDAADSVSRRDRGSRQADE